MRAETGDVDWPVERSPDWETVAGEAAGVLGVAMSDVRVNGHRLGDRKALVVEWCRRFAVHESGGNGGSGIVIVWYVTVK